MNDVPLKKILTSFSAAGIEPEVVGEAGQTFPSPQESGDIPIRFPFRLKLAVSFSLLLILMTGAVSFWLINHQTGALRREAEKRARSLAQNLAANVRLPILGEDTLFLGSAVESIMMEPDVMLAYVLDHDGRIVYHSNPDLVGRVFSDTDIPPPDRMLHAAIPVVVEAVKVGAAGVAIDVEHINRSLVLTLFELLVPLALATVVGVFVFFFLSGIHVRRLENLLEGVRRVERGDLQVRVPEKGRDEVTRLTRHFNLMVDTVRAAHMNLERNFRETISALAAAVEARDRYTRDHCERVARISREIAIRVGMDAETLRELEIAAILHDVGKIGVDEDLLAKSSPLNDGDRTEIRRHPEIGHRILDSLSSLGNVGTFVRHHHECFDGTGYPDGLKGDGIPLPARIIGLVDAFDAMTSNRVYRDALSREEAFRRISAGSGTQFDPALVKVFEDLESQGIILQIAAEASTVVV